MMMDPAQYVEQYKNAPYLELLKIKNELISYISEFEHDYYKKKLDWKVCPSPDVHYQWNLEVLGLIAPMLSEAFFNEYEWLEKSLSDYRKDMRKFYT